MKFDVIIINDQINNRSTQLIKIKIHFGTPVQYTPFQSCDLENDVNSCHFCHVLLFNWMFLVATPWFIQTEVIYFMLGAVLHNTASSVTNYK